RQKLLAARHLLLVRLLKIRERPLLHRLAHHRLRAPASSQIGAIDQSFPRPVPIDSFQHPLSVYQDLLEVRP
ncbi:hypothetical protein KHP57_02805, partial [Algiphilus sp. NNCM1]|nr:hypothetical protein [Algiphilus acroporae]